ncbi:hypothetical protein N7462_000830 [Penicillium macrosclerotiorum]|uniref:uncharacterized protein n=1 Tax=Penicillium macrosclerotiorum TaxID=303699 RepID=UPI002548D312|nr:uncharacterized protein N7462_000830 [Penicillium macrosclerotiorum]KAJ5698825.1 hypothetical protein N7462_000830 [Penicillium macrosclerotiorum]
MANVIGESIYFRPARRFLAASDWLSSGSPAISSNPQFLNSFLAIYVADSRTLRLMLVRLASHQSRSGPILSGPSPVVPGEAPTSSPSSLGTNDGRPGWTADQTVPNLAVVLLLLCR